MCLICPLATLSHGIYDKSEGKSNIESGNRCWIFGFACYPAIGQATGEAISHTVTARRHGDPAQLIAVSKLAKDKIGFECKYSDLETILESMWNVYNNQKSVC